MKKRLKKKLRNELTKDELLVLELFRECTDVTFYQYRSNEDAALKLCERVGRVRDYEFGTFVAYKARKGKVETVAFVDVDEND